MNWIIRLFVYLFITTERSYMVEKKTIKKAVPAKKAPVKVTKKAEPKVSPKTTVQKTVVSKETKVAATMPVKRSTGLNVDIVDTAGKVVSTIKLPAEVFGTKINKPLIAQAIRVYLVNQRQGTVSTKTRGEVDGSTRKIYRQKGTGRARHGGVRAPIFVKGGIAHGPKPYDYALSLSKKMKKAAFTSALSARAEDGAITVVAGFEKLAPKTKEFAGAFEKIGMSAKRNVLFVLPKDTAEVMRGARNLAGLVLTTADRLSTYDVVKYKQIVLMQETVDALVKRVQGDK